MIIKSYTNKGTRTLDNRDVLLKTVNGDSHLFMVIDGNTSCPSSGDFARSLAAYIENTLGKLPPHSLKPPFAKDTLLTLLKEAQQKLRTDFPADSASILLLYIQKNISIALYAGDCCLGRLSRDYPLSKASSIKWLTHIHSLANAQKDIRHSKIKSNPNRHIRRFSS